MEEEEEEEVEEEKEELVVDIVESGNAIHNGLRGVEGTYGIDVCSFFSKMVCGLYNELESSIAWFQT